jgi:hypothetical protein
LSFGSKAAKEWAHANADDYGLAFTVSGEDWHISPLYQFDDDSVVTKCK